MKKLLHYEIEGVFKEDDKHLYYLAHNTLIDKKVSIVVLNDQLSKDPKEVEHFLQSKTQQANLHHSNLNIIYDIVELGGNVYSIEEYIEGHTLQHYIDNVSGPIPEDKATRLFGQLLDATSFLHHRAIYPSQIHAQNIIITKGENLKLLYNPVDEVPNQSRYLYESPEELEGQAPSKASNIFRLGIILYQMVSGKYPLANQKDKQAIKSHLKKAKFPKATQYYEGVNARTQNIIDKALALKPNNRFKDCQSFKESLNYDREAKGEAVPQKGFKQLPLLLLFLFVGICGLFYMYANRTVNSAKVTYDLQDTQALKQLKDSLLKAKRDKVMQDSLRLTQIQARDTMKVYIHKVQRGESIQGIAKQYNMTLGHFQRLNNIESNDDLKAGAGMRVMLRAVHKVLANENAHTVAKEYGLTYYDIIRTNKIEDEAEEIFEGKELLIPFK